MKGVVYLVGAGPGDPRLLTLRGKELLENCDVVVQDALVHPSILNFARRARKIFVGKRGGTPHLPQSEINKLLVRLARRGLRVVRLKGGDPFVFGRGGEEALALSRAKVHWEIVPGVTSASAAPAAARIPVTHRSATSVWTILTGQEGKENTYKGPGVDWKKISKNSTLTILMGRRELPKIVRRLLRLGWSAKTPSAAISWATWPNQRLVEGPLSGLPQLADRAGISAPATIVIGKVVRLRRRLQPKLPLWGKTVLVTRARSQISEFARRLRRLGARVLEFPTIEFRPPESFRALDRALKNFSDYDWLILTSANAASALADRARRLGVRLSLHPPVCAIGPATAKAARAAGLKVARLAEDFIGEAVAKALGAVRGKKILLPRAAKARAVLPRMLRARGAKVTLVPAYRTVPARPPLAKLRKAEIDWITFTSSSTVRNFLRAVPARLREKLLARARLAAIGPVTESELRAHGLEPAVVSRPYTTAALARALAEQS